MTLTAGQRGDAPQADRLLDASPRPRRVLADAAYDSGAIRARLAAAGVRAVIPPQPTRKEPAACDRRAYRRRNRVERLVARLKQFRRVATRYDKLARTFLAFVHPAAALIATR